MSKLLVNLALLNTKALVNLYTLSTLPFYAAIQRPWRKLKLSKTFGVTTEVQKNGSRIIYSRPKEADIGRHPYYRHSTFPEAFASLAGSTKPAIGVREVIQETAAVDEAGKPVLVEGKPLMKVQLAKEYQWLTAADVMTKVDCLARGLREMGIGKGDHVLIYAENGVQWFYTCLALARLNAVMVTLFSTLGDSGVVYGMNQSDARFVVTSESLLPKLNALSGQFQHLQSIVYIRDEKKKADSLKTAETQRLVEQLKEKNFSVTPFDQVEAVGAKVAPCDFPPPHPNDIAVIMYTSGTTGDPKGVIIPHRQLNASIKNLLRMDEEIGSFAFSGQVSAAYLPQAHLFGYLLNLSVFCSDSKLAFSSPLTLLSSSPAHVKGQDGDMKHIQPQFFIAVPLVLERILKEIYRKLNAKSPLAAPLFDYAMQYKIRWMQRGFDTPIINRLICKKINEQFGGKLKLIGVSSAPLAESTHALVQAALNVNVVNAYGATETCGGSHMLHVDDLAYGTCGVPYSSSKFYLKSWDEGSYSTEDKPNPRGEIVLGGDTIASGYYKMEEETKRAFEVDENGEIWYSSGDIGEVLPNGTLKIIDRKKDLQKLANGEFVSLGKIESGLRNSPFVENICVCTDPFSNHLTALVSPNRKALEELAGQLQLQQQSTFEQICASPEVVNHVRKSLKALCKQLGFKIREVPVQITLVTEEWSQDNNLLTAAFKLKRKQVTDFYAPQIRDMFALANASGDAGPSVGCQLAKAVRGGKSEDTPSITVT